RDPAGFPGVAYVPHVEKTKRVQQQAADDIGSDGALFSTRDLVQEDVARFPRLRAPIGANPLDVDLERLGELAGDADGGLDRGDVKPPARGLRATGRGRARRRA